MAKFAVVILAAFAFQAASAGVLNMPYGMQDTMLGGYGNELQHYGYGLEYHGYPTGKFDYLFGKLQTVSHDLTQYFQKALPNDRLVLKTLVWQSRELAMYLDTIIEKLQAETVQCQGEVRMVLEQFVSELREIKMQYHQIAAYTSDVYVAHQMKNEFHLNVQRTIVQLEKMVRFVQTSFDQTHGELYFIVKNVIADFLYAFQNIYSHVQYYGVYAEQSPMHLVRQIQEVTRYLTGYFQGLTHFDAQRMHVVREYVQHVETIIRRMQEVEGTYGNTEIDVALQQVYGKLRRVLVPFMQMYDTTYNMENVDVIRTQLIEEFQFVAEAFEQFVQYAHVGQYQAFFYEILGDYLYAIQQFRMHIMQSGLESYHGLYQGEFYGRQELPAFYAKYGQQGLYQHAGLYGKTGYQGLYRYGGYGYGFAGKYQGFAKYGQDVKQFQVQFQTIIRDLYQTFQTVSFDDVTVKHTFIQLIREYAQQLEFIADKLHQYVSYTTETDMYIYQQVAQNLRQYVVELEQFYIREFPTTELTAQFYMYVQKISAEFEKLFVGMEKTHGTFYELTHTVLYQYFTATYDLYRHMENIHEITRYGYGPYARQYYYGREYYGKYFGGKYFGQHQGQEVYETPRELVNQIQYVATELSATFQEGMIFNQQHAQLLAVHARHFAQIIKNVVDQLEAYEHVDAIIEQVIYKLREVQMHFYQLASFNDFTNAHQLRTEFDNYIQIAVAQIEKLVMIAQEEAHGNFYYVIKDVLHFFLYGLHDIHRQIQQVAQYGQLPYYGQQYGFPKYGQQWAKYGQQYGQQWAQYGQQWAKYGKQFGYAKYAQKMMGLGLYGKGHGYGYQQVPYTQYTRSWAATPFAPVAIRAY